ncbi:hypothetical protein AC578_3103 [Pseudocercospora eumusae]|uniref:Methylated-DNA-[protein]-cysteine S-methyltransferase DNA binding domain-containing protein n=1 Tax=Pseudocercospora eumusae TaxID=321146 RepID=A0A139GV16_9PEZI|nr:hypothetical protein AC578_3103 [Pseudocercospora eumusae]
MPRERSDEAEAWYAAVYQAVQEVPYGHVTSYGHIATLLGYPCTQRAAQTSRHVPEVSASSCRSTRCSLQQRYSAMAAGDQLQRHHQSKASLTCYGNTVASHDLCLLTSDAFRGANGAARQEAQLNVEGVEVGRGPLGERTVDFSTYGWFPNTLPSEES